MSIITTLTKNIITRASTNKVIQSREVAVFNKFADEVNGASTKTTPVNTDLLGIVDTEASNVVKKLSFTNLKAFLKTYFDGIYGTGTGDMTKAVYDPTNINSSAFNVDNHTSGTTNKVYTATEQSKLSGIEAGAEVNNISDVNATDLTDSGATTLHKHSYNNLDDKPTIPTALSQLSEDTTHRIVTDTEKGIWNGKQDALGYTAENVANKETSALDTSTTKYPCNNVVKTAVDLKADKTNLNALVFDTTPSGLTHTDGQLYYDSTNKTLAVNLDTDITLQIGQEEQVYVYNPSASQIDNGKAVYISGASGNFPTIALAQANNFTTSFVLGLATQNIPATSYGYVCIRGMVNDVNTDSWTVGDELFLDATTAGSLTNTKPTAPNYDVRIGRVIVKNSSTGKIYVRQRAATKLDDLADVTIGTPATDEVLRYNGQEWVNGASVTSSASAGIEFYPDVTKITDSSTENSVPIETLNKYPVILGSPTVDTIACTSNTVLKSAYLYNTALGRTTIDAGNWGFEYYAGVNSVLAGRVSTITKQIYAVSPDAVNTITITGSGTSRTCTASGGTPFATTKIVASATNTLASFVQTPKGLYQITARTSDTEVTIATPTGYSNESTVAFSVWKKLFGATSPTITNISPNYGLYRTNSAQAAFTVLATDKLGKITFGTSNNTTTVSYVYNSSTQYSHFETPLITMHNNLAGLQGGTSNEYYHVTAAEKTVVANTSGTNTGDNATNSQYSGLASSKQDTLTFGIANTNSLRVDDASAADNDYAKFTATGIEGRSYSEVKTDLSLNNVENTALSTWAGSGNIATVGTVTSGTLSTGAVVAGVTMTLGSDAEGDIYYRNSSGVLTRLAKGTNGHYLKQGANVPEWAAAAGGAPEGTAVLSTGEAGGTKFLREDGDGTCSWQTVPGGAMVISPWLDISGTYASAATFTITGTAAQALAIQHCLFTCLKSDDSVRRIGYVKSASESGGTVTVTVVTDTDLANGDKNFKVTPSIKLSSYERNISIPEELVVDATNPQGIWYDNIKVASYLLPVDSSVRTAAAGAGAAAAFNVYADATNLFSSALDLTTNAVLVEQRPNTNTIAATDTVSVRVTGSAGATNKAKDLQVRLYIVPQSLFTGAA